ncbi:RES family NAD+ phosphorylase [Saccharopolyspora oryzae]|uniref:RES family NAD+ phosphorylase n=1 Tax=Saccharopolyspora oryzae TaxID=2997343 RepID=A0ABT4V1J5_9PSEU|nr:RES family NAD+ phosphorylase [Saccharopolyspora oryzae]MDA3627824.1 RES family NAD+ phosphorylase [Saccharopolyspora oryzae]
MPQASPPLQYAATPNRHAVPADTELFRIHERKRHAAEFKPAHVSFGSPGGRFDGTPDDPFSSYYAGLHTTTALAEVLLRNLGFDGDGQRLIRRQQIAGRRFSSVRTNRELTLVSLLTAPDLAAVAQDSWLVDAEGRDAYPHTRRWAAWIRSQAPWADGLIWPSKRDTGNPAVVLFGDRCADALEGAEPELQIDLDTPIGEAWLTRMLAPYRAAIAPSPN